MKPSSPFAFSLQQLGIVTVFSVGMAWGTTQASLRHKVDRDELTQLTARIDSLRADASATRTDVQNIVRYLCKKDASMLGCP